MSAEQETGLTELYLKRIEWGLTRQRAGLLKPNVVLVSGDVAALVPSEVLGIPVVAVWAGDKGYICIGLYA